MIFSPYDSLIIILRRKCDLTLQHVWFQRRKFIRNATKLDKTIIFQNILPESLTITIFCGAMISFLIFVTNDNFATTYALYLIQLHIFQ